MSEPIDPYMVALDLLAKASKSVTSYHLSTAIACFLGEETPECTCDLCKRIGAVAERARGVIAGGKR